jgi:membrane associated rhomboid family serine protease
MIRLTPVVKNLIFICVGVFILQMMVEGFTRKLSLYPWGTPYFQPYQLFTYMFAHGGTGHIFFNMLTFAFMGPALEEVMGFKRFLKYYIITGIGAAIIYMAFEQILNPGSTVPMLGASGAIYGILMAYAFIFPELEVRMLFIPVPIKGKYLAVVLGVFAFLMERARGGDGGNIAHFAHLGGAVTGFIALRFGLLKD